MKMPFKIKLPWWPLKLTIFFLALAVLAGFFLFFVSYQILAPRSSNYFEKTFLIEKNQGLKEIAGHLAEAKIIRSKFWFMFYAFSRGWADNLQTGEYSLSPSMNIKEVARMLAFGEALPNQVRVTIPEGYNLKQIDELLAKANLIKSGDLIEDYSQLEGYLFPDTYLFNKEADLEEITAKIIGNFNKKITEAMNREISRQGKTLSEIVIMASIIEKEIAGYENSRIVSGVFWKRIKNNHPLESCATLAYILGVNKWRYSIEDTKINSPYNTYQNVGLPPGPICSPGLTAISAAIYPQYTDYNYFLAKPNGETVFSRTYQEHVENKAKYLR
jgi:UPF0755 protein